MTWQTFLMFAGVYAAVCLLPGPAVVALVMRSIANGFWQTMPYMLGLVVADVVLLTLTAAGLATLAEALGSAFFVIKIAGACYLVWLGYRLWVAPADTVTPPPSTARTTFFGGVALGCRRPRSSSRAHRISPTIFSNRWHDWADRHRVLPKGWQTTCWRPRTSRWSLPVR